MEKDRRGKKLNYFDKLKVKKNCHRQGDLPHVTAAHYEKFN
jgi:hypothetical protein